MSLLNALDQSESHENGGWAQSHHMPMTSEATETSDVSWRPAGNSKRNNNTRLVEYETNPNSEDEGSDDIAYEGPAEDEPQYHDADQRQVLVSQNDQDEFVDDEEQAGEEEDFDLDEDGQYAHMDYGDELEEGEEIMNDRVVQRDQYENEGEMLDDEGQGQFIDGEEQYEDEGEYDEEGNYIGEGEGELEGGELPTERDEIMDADYDYEADEEMVLEGEDMGDEYDEGIDNYDNSEELLECQQLLALQQQTRKQQMQLHLLQRTTNILPGAQKRPQQKLPQSSNQIRNNVAGNRPTDGTNKPFAGMHVYNNAQVEQLKMHGKIPSLPKQNEKGETIQYIFIKKKAQDKLKNPDSFTVTLPKNPVQQMKATTPQSIAVQSLQQGQNKVTKISPQSLTQMQYNAPQMKTQTAQPKPPVTIGNKLTTVGQLQSVIKGGGNRNISDAKNSGAAPLSTTSMGTVSTVTGSMATTSNTTSTSVTGRRPIRGTPVTTQVMSLQPAIKEPTVSSYAGALEGLRSVVVGNRVFRHMTTTESPSPPAGMATKTVQHTNTSTSSPAPRIQARKLPASSLVMCPNCGETNSSYKCHSCLKPIPVTSKVIDRTPIDEHQFYGMEEPVFNTRKTTSTYGGHGVRIKRTPKRTAAGSRKQAKLMTEPEVVTINSSEDEEDTQPKSVTVHIGTSSSSSNSIIENRVVVTPTSTPIRQGASTPTTAKTPTVSGASSSTSSSSSSSSQKAVSFDATKVYVGTLKGKPYKPLLLSRDAIHVEMEAEDDSVKLRIPMMELMSCQMCAHIDAPALYLDVDTEYAKQVSSVYGLTLESGGPYFDPSSSNEKHRRIIIVMKKPSQDLLDRVRALLDDINISRAEMVDQGTKVVRFMTEINVDQSLALLELSIGPDSDVAMRIRRSQSQRESIDAVRHQIPATKSSMALLQTPTTPTMVTSRQISLPPVMDMSVMSPHILPGGRIVHLSRPHNMMVNSPMSHGGIVTVNTLVGPVQITRQTDEDGDRSRSPTPPRPVYMGPVVKLFTYPPPPTTGAITVSTEDLFCLTEGEFLNDVIIDFYLKYLVLTLLSEEQRQKTHVFSSFFYRRLTQRPAKRQSEDISLSLSKKRHNRVKTWTRHVDLFSKDFLILPINESAHWFLAIVCFPSQQGPIVKKIPITISKAKVDKTKTDTKNETVTDRNETESESKEEDSQAKEETDNESGRKETGVNNDKDKGGKNVNSGDRNESQMDCSQDETECEKMDCDRKDESTKSSSDVTQSTESTEPVQMRSITEKQPCILMMDSLTGSRSHTVKIIRDYLQVEWDVKKKETLGARVFNKDQIRGTTVKVPQQNNFSDCGLYVLQYVEQFFKDPIVDYSIPIPHLEHWFPQEVCDGKRQQIRLLIMDLQKKFNPGLDLKLTMS